MLAQYDVYRNIEKYIDEWTNGHTLLCCVSLALLPYVKAVEQRRQILWVGENLERGREGGSRVLEHELVEPRKAVDVQLTNDGRFDELEPEKGEAIQRQVEKQSPERKGLSGAEKPEVEARRHRNEDALVVVVFVRIGR